jgi:hypothetical protein
LARGPFRRVVAFSPSNASDPNFVAVPVFSAILDDFEIWSTSLEKGIKRVRLRTESHKAHVVLVTHGGREAGRQRMIQPVWY